MPSTFCLWNLGLYATGEGLQEREENLSEKWNKENPCYLVAERLTTLNWIVQKVEHMPNELGDLPKEMYKKRDT